MPGVLRQLGERFFIPAGLEPLFVSVGEQLAINPGNVGLDLGSIRSERRLHPWIALTSGSSIRQRLPFRQDSCRFLFKAIRRQCRQFPPQPQRGMFRPGILLQVFTPLLNQPPPQVLGIVGKKRECFENLQISFFKQDPRQIIRRLFASLVHESRINLGVEVRQLL